MEQKSVSVYWMKELVMRYVMKQMEPSTYKEILPVLDLISLFIGDYSYQEITYYQMEHEIQCRKEKVYVERCHGVCNGHKDLVTK